jgi:type I restriction-modification system DNA methylase subunit
LESLQNAPNIYRRMRELFQRADDRYNSGLFHFTQEKDRSEPPDELTLDLTIEDKPLQDILGGLYYPESPYEFSVFPVEILGQVYEQFLGKVIRLTKGHQAKVEEKPEVRKAGGIYYTPSYIVDYIVSHTVGKLLSVDSSVPYSIARSVTNSKITPTHAAKLRILDPACGSGSFLLGAYQYLLDWHRDWYINNDFNKYAKGRNPKLYKSYSGDWRLTSAERKRILLNNIYGVDIDEQAVEVTKLSLLLKVLEGESGETVDNQIRLFHERALPDLGDNIKCGNSLIGPDFYNGHQLKLFDEEEKLRINAFDWHDKTLGFGKIMSAGGFNAIIGNPPWGASFIDDELSYLRNKHKEIIKRMIDSFMYFLHASSKKMKEHAFLGMILPDVILYQIDNEILRQYILEKFKIHRILNLGNVFEKVTRPSCILILEQAEENNWNIQVADFSSINKSDKPSIIFDKHHYVNVPQRELSELPSALYITSDVSCFSIWNKINTLSHILLGNIVDKHGIQRGVSPDLKEAFIVDQKTAKKWKLERQYLRNVLTGGKHVKRYFFNHPNLLLIYTDRNTNFRDIPNICAYIDQFRNKITCKEVKQKKHPLYALHRARDENIFVKDEKIIGVITEDRITVTLDESQLFASDGLYLFGVLKPVSSKYVIGVLNSQLFLFIYRLLAMEEQRVLAQVKPTLLSQLPIRTINFSDKADKRRHDRMVSLVETMLELHKREAEMKGGHEKTVVERQIAATDKQIDQLVYELYGLTDEEIAIVEQNT